MLRFLLLLMIFYTSCVDDRTCYEVIDEHGIDGELILPRVVSWINDDNNPRKEAVIISIPHDPTFAYDTMSFDMKAGTFRHKYKYNWNKYFYDTITEGIDEGFFELITKDRYISNPDNVLCWYRDSIAFWGDGMPRQQFAISRFCNHLEYFFTMPTKRHGIFYYKVYQGSCMDVR